MTITLDSELKQLLDSPRLPFIARKIDAVLADEARRRQGFYTQISEGDKAEFINGQIIFHGTVPAARKRGHLRVGHKSHDRPGA